jgi:hypothetical protein
MAGKAAQKSNSLLLTIADLPAKSSLPNKADPDAAA